MDLPAWHLALYPAASTGVQGDFDYSRGPTWKEKSAAAFEDGWVCHAVLAV